MTSIEPLSVIGPTRGIIMPEQDYVSPGEPIGNEDEEEDSTVDYDSDLMPYDWDYDALGVMEDGQYDEICNAVYDSDGYMTEDIIDKYDTEDDD